MEKVSEFNKKTTVKKVTDFAVGDTVAVVQKIKEGGKDRLQTFEGLVISKKHGTEPGATFTVRKVSGGVGVERIFPLYSPNIDKIKVVKSAKVRRSKLYYLRTAKGKRAKLKKKELALAVAIAPEKVEEVKSEEMVAEKAE
jgi:large subunit ribosomal protein L19